MAHRAHALTRERYSFEAVGEMTERALKEILA